MRLTLAAVGRARSGPEMDLFQQYARRLTPALVLREVEERRSLPTDRLKAREAELLLGCVPAGAIAVALDEHGQQLDSRGFADRLRGWRESGVGDLVFLIGGADGHGQAVRERADLLVSLGLMTWPHLLVRALLAEQLWRAPAILAGHPYHRD